MTPPPRLVLSMALRHQSPKRRLQTFDPRSNASPKIGSTCTWTTLRVRLRLLQHNHTNMIRALCKPKRSSRWPSARRTKRSVDWRTRPSNPMTTTAPSWRRPFWGPTCRIFAKSSNSDVTVAVVVLLGVGAVVATIRSYKQPQTAVKTTPEQQRGTILSITRVLMNYDELNVVYSTLYLYTLPKIT